ncbi:MAG TPA: glycine betaine ABC transporter substrate-binding protein, partial [Pyrinomonadaceae bacterium]|nr:glycine betaine ABC transporter substrate-binding protein [Pyrinomonadaceae bacterium]
GIEVDRRFDLGGNLAHSALIAGQIDLYPEYTGTAFTAILHHQPISDPKAVYDQVQGEYYQRFNLWVSPPLGFENTFAILVRGEDARRLNLKTISDAAKYSPQWQAGFGHDFINRQDGYPGFSKTYNLQFRGVSDMALDLTYTALSSHQVDMIAGNSTDGRIAALNLVQLEDDKHYFPPYQAVFMIRRPTEFTSPSTDASVPLVLVMAKLHDAISSEEMRKLNYEVDGARRDKKVVVREWLVSKGFVKP